MASHPCSCAAVGAANVASNHRRVAGEKRSRTPLTTAQGTARRPGNVVAVEIVRWENRPKLRRPVLVAAFEGWNDAGDAASSAARYLAAAWGARAFASIECEDFYDFTSTRPQVRLVDGLTREIDWPTNEFTAANVPGLGRDVVFLHGVEPQLKWRTFCSSIIDTAQSLGVEMAITLGALLT